MSLSQETSGVSYEILVEEDSAGHTVRSIVQRNLRLSRRMLRQLVANNQIRLNGDVAYLTARASRGDIMNVMLPSEHTDISPEATPLDIRYEDRETLVLNKPAGMLTHPTAREREGSLLAAAYHYIYPQVPHCVHRLDRETSGLVMLAKHGHFHHLYDECLRQGKIHRVYCALIHIADEDDVFLGWDTIDLPIAGDPNAPSRRIISAGGQRAITHYRILDVQGGVGVAIVVLETGRTHQIRLHFSAVGQPLVGDPVYGRRPSQTSGDQALSSPGQSLPIHRQALHALGMWFIHPVTHEEHRVFADVPDDILGAWAAFGGDANTLGAQLQNAFLETEIFANIEMREELT